MAQPSTTAAEIPLIVVKLQALRISCDQEIAQLEQEAKVLLEAMTTEFTNLVAEQVNAGDDWDIMLCEWYGEMWELEQTEAYQNLMSAIKQREERIPELQAEIAACCKDAKVPEVVEEVATLLRDSLR